MSSVIKATKQRTEDEHFECMREMLEVGKAYFLIGGTILPDGRIHPVTFCFNLPDHIAQAISDKTPDAVDALLASVTQAVSQNQTFH